MAITGINTFQDYSYTSGIQSFTAPFGGLYLFQLWGASGGGYTNRSSGGAGGYVYGYKQMSAGDTLYLCVGGAGGTGSDTASRVASGGYNGGGSGGRFASTGIGSGGGGGGATSLSTVYATIAGNVGACLLIAGGGGGGGQTASGGIGGGYSSLNGGVAGDSNTGVPTPTSAGYWYYASGNYYIYSGVGQGLSGYPVSYNGPSFQLNGGGGGGRYGGSTGQYKGGTGGSGYIGGLPTITFNGKTYSSGYGGTQNGNGKARVTFVDYASNVYFNGTRVTDLSFDGTAIKKVIYNGTTVFG